MEIRERNVVTSYLKKTILAQVDKSIDFKKGEFYKISKEQFANGQIDDAITQKMFEKNKKSKENDDKENIDEILYVIVAAKIIKVEMEGSQRKDEEIEDLTGVFYIPALLSKKTSSLLPCLEENKLPWFPRDLLFPMIEPELAIGYLDNYEEIISNQLYNIYKIKSWDEYIKFCKEIYEQTTGCEFESNEVNDINGDNKKIKLEDNMYIFCDNMINSTRDIKRLYSDILKQERKLPLYERFISMKSEEDRDLIKNTVENRKKHFGQMGGMFGLSHSQRESLNHFSHIKDGEILSIQGPPGTGKTTLLQSIIATKYVESALKQEAPPLMVATSTNNQAVTNIIDSFGRITSNFKNNLGERWIEGVKSFATYLPSVSRQKGAKEKGFQYTNKRGEFFIKEVDNEKNIKFSKEKFLKEAKKFFKEKENLSLEKYKIKLNKRLVKLNNLKNDLIDIAQSIHNEIGDDINIKDFIQTKENNIHNFENDKKSNNERIIFWEQKYKNEIPIFWKAFSFIPKYKMRISNKLKMFVNYDEEFNKENLNIDSIKEYYVAKQDKLNESIRQEKKQQDEVVALQEDYKNIIKQLEEYGVNTTEAKKKMIIDCDELDNWIDKNIRYTCFWLAVHYYEARWLDGEYSLTESQKGTTFSNVLEYTYRRLSLITPCLVMTFYKLPYNFEAYISEDTWEYMYNMIDFLIVDEAGQVSTEIGACSFALAKRALIVGDEKQIEPVWAIEKPLDKTLAIQEKVIANETEFEKIEKLGITASSSSVMKVACKASNYNKFNQKGLFLSEHRRCYDDIVNYCNKLVYNGNLQLLRGNGKENAILPKMGYFQIDVERSKKVGNSRINTEEAVQIANWIKRNAYSIFEYYKQIAIDNNKNPNDVDLSKIIGVITPFKEQTRELKKVFNAILPIDLLYNIDFGTVHTFQGGERKIIIFSSTYGSKDGCFFIDYKKNLMNVAVSRAEDSFLVFGNINCLKDEKTSPSGLLKGMILGEGVKDIL